MNRTQKILFNSVSTIILQIITIIAGFIIPRIMLTVYGSEINGLVTSITQFISYFSLVEVGLSGAAVFSLYKPLADQNHKAISAIVSATRNFYLISGYIFVSITVGMAVIYPIFVRTSISPFNVGVLVLVLGFAGALEFITLAKYRVLLTADQKIYVISIASIVSIVISTILIAYFSTNGSNIALVRFIALLSIFARSLILTIYVKIKYKYLNFKEKPDKGSLSNRWSVFYWQIVTTIQSGSTVVIATIFTDLKTVSIFTVFNLVISGIRSILSSVTNGLYTSFGEIIVRGNQAELQRTYREFEFVFYNLITIVFSISLINIMPFIRIFTRNITDTNYDLPILGFLLILNGLLYSIKEPHGTLVMAAGLYRETRVQVSIQSTIAVLGGIILVKFYGLNGIIIGMIASNIYRWNDLLFFVPNNITKVKIRFTLFRQLRLIFSVLVCCCPFYIFKSLNIPYGSPSGYIQWFIDAAISGIYCITIVFCVDLIFERQELKNVFKRIKVMFNRINISI